MGAAVPVPAGRGVEDMKRYIPGEPVPEDEDTHGDIEPV
jgi:hypothetical protein